MALGAAVTSAALFTATAAIGETLIQNTVENRVLLAFKVDGAALAEVMPEGWMPITLPKGPVAGSNLILSFFDRLLITDAEGKPADPASSPVLALVAYGKAEGVEGVRTFVTAIYEVPPMVDPFGRVRRGRHHPVGGDDLQRRRADALGGMDGAAGQRRCVQLRAQLPGRGLRLVGRRREHALLGSDPSCSRSTATTNWPNSR